MMQEMFEVTYQDYEVRRNSEEVLWTELTVGENTIPQKAIEILKRVTPSLTTKKGFVEEDGYETGDELGDTIRRIEHLWVIGMQDEIGGEKRITGWNVLFGPFPDDRGAREGIIEIAVEPRESKIGKERLMLALHRSSDDLARLILRGATEEEFLRHYLGK